MKILTTKEYKYLTDVEKEYKQRLDDLKTELREAKDFKSILSKLTENSLYGMDGVSALGYANGSVHFNIPDNVLVYVDDILGGKVIKQEANKCIVIDKKGNVKNGVTKSNNDKGYDYKLVRE